MRAELVGAKARDVDALEMGVFREVKAKSGVSASDSDSVISLMEERMRGRVEGRNSDSNFVGRDLFIMAIKYENIGREISFGKIIESFIKAAVVTILDASTGFI